MLTFSMLKFKKHPYSKTAKLAKMNFKNGYGVSVLCGTDYYSNGIDTYEVAVLKNGLLCYDTYIAKDVLPYKRIEEVNGIMRKIQAL